jgi:hypothetical protein
MNNTYFKLEFPKNPLQITDLSPYDADNFWTIETDVRKILSQELSDVFEKIGVYPSFAVFFVVQSGYREARHDLAHVDYTRVNDEWRKVPFAINWELIPDITSTLSWYDASKCTETQVGYNGNPAVDAILNYLNGTFFNGDVSVIDQVKCSYGRPLMVRTNVPHTLSDFKTNGNKRYCLSLRFDIEQIESWEQATNIFKDYIINDI